jgi:serine/threonine protein kinase
MTDWINRDRPIPTQTNLQSPSSFLNYSGELTASNGGLLADRYAILSKLGQGGFGKTYLARNIRIPGAPQCVIKKLSSDRHQHQQIELEIARWQFEQEAFCLSKLGAHAQIPTILDYFHADGESYLVQEYIPGHTLAALVRQGQKFTPTQVEKFLRQMLMLLEYIHSHNLIHRDIKPENIIFCQTDRRFVLLDFGSVKDLNPVGRERSNIHSHSIGTPGYAPPEQLANRAVHASDIYALGMTCIYLLTGTPPQQFPTNPHTCELEWADDLEIGQDLYDPIAKTIQLSLANRYQSATQALTAMENQSVRSTLKTYLDRKYAVAKSEPLGSRLYYPSVIHRALGIENS